MTKSTIGIFLALFAAIFLSAWFLSFSNALAGNKNEKEKEPVGIPTIQEKFVELVCAAQSADSDAYNSLGKLEISKKLESDLKKLFGKSKLIKQWHVTLGLVEVDSKGLAQVVFELGQPDDTSSCHIMLSNVEQTGLFSHKYYTTIRHGSKLFHQLASMECCAALSLTGYFATNRKGIPKHDGLDNFFIKIKSLVLRVGIDNQENDDE